MKYNRIHLEAIGYELPPVVVSTAELENRLAPVYQALKMAPGQLELLTGITERRWWEPGFPISLGAAAAAKKALAAADISAADIDVLIYAGVCREQFEPATACAVAHELKINSNAAIFDLSNACLGVLNGIVEIANKIELGQAKAGLVVSAETAREINENVIDRMVHTRSAELFRESVATLTGGSGAVAVLVTSEELSSHRRRKLLGGVTQNATQHNALCRWGLQSILPVAGAAAERVFGHNARALVQKGVDNAGALVQKSMDFGLRHVMVPFMETHAGEVLKYGVELGLRTWQSFLAKFGWRSEQMDKIICHQVGAGHRDAVLKAIGVPVEKEFSTFEYLGNIGTVSLPITAAIAEEREFLQPGDRVGFLGIGSGLNCLMLGLEW
jgi:3-oxoacyl-[acyl-carrier-protein] synthase-3